jgi:ribosomal protein S12 methylthiotransferase accessory factor
VNIETFPDKYAVSLREYYESLGRRVWVLDVSFDHPVAVFVAVSCWQDRNPQDITIGFGAHVDPTVALRRAMTEMSQLLPAVCSASDDTKMYRNANREADYWFRNATLESQEYLVPDPDVPFREYGNFVRLRDFRIGGALQWLVEQIKSRGLDAYVVDQTRAELDLKVVKAIVPGLRHFWRRLAPGRLYDVPVALHYLDKATSERGVNDYSVFF